MGSGWHNSRPSDAVKMLQLIKAQRVYIQKPSLKSLEKKNTPEVIQRNFKRNISIHTHTHTHIFSKTLALNSKKIKNK